MAGPRDRLDVKLILSTDHNTTLKEQCNTTVVVSFIFEAAINLSMLRKGKPLMSSIWAKPIPFFIYHSTAKGLYL